MTEIRPLAADDTIRQALDDHAQAQLDALTAEVAEDPSRLGRTFPAAARKTGRGPLAGADDVLLEDAVRVSLVQTAAQLPRPARRSWPSCARSTATATTTRSARSCTPCPAHPTTSTAPTCSLDALRTNDTRLVAAAMGPHSDRLDDDSWRQGVLKCLFTGVPVASVTGLARRADRELAEMVQRYRREREAAGRDVPLDVQVVLDACAASTQHDQQKDS